MEMINKQALEDLRAADMPEKQAEAVASHIPDWSQFATKTDLKDLRNDLTWRMLVIMAVPIVLSYLERFLPG